MACMFVIFVLLVASPLVHPNDDNYYLHEENMYSSKESVCYNFNPLIYSENGDLYSTNNMELKEEDSSQEYCSNSSCQMNVRTGLRKRSEDPSEKYIKYLKDYIKIAVSSIDSNIAGSDKNNLNLVDGRLHTYIITKKPISGGVSWMFLKFYENVMVTAMYLYPPRKMWTHGCPSEVKKHLEILKNAEVYHGYSMHERIFSAGILDLKGCRVRYSIRSSLRLIKIELKNLSLAISEFHFYGLGTSLKSQKVATAQGNMIKQLKFAAYEFGGAFWAPIDSRRLVRSEILYYRVWTAKYKKTCVLSSHTINCVRGLNPLISVDSEAPLNGKPCQQVHVTNHTHMDCNSFPRMEYWIESKSKHCNTYVEVCLDAISLWGVEATTCQTTFINCLNRKTFSTYGTQIAQSTRIGNHFSNYAIDSNMNTGALPGSSISGRKEEWWLIKFDSVMFMKRVFMYTRKAKEVGTCSSFDLTLMWGQTLKTLHEKKITKPDSQCELSESVNDYLVFLKLVFHDVRVHLMEFGYEADSLFPNGKFGKSWVQSYLDKYVSPVETGQGLTLMYGLGKSYQEVIYTKFELIDDAKKCAYFRFILDCQDCEESSAESREAVKTKWAKSLCSSNAQEHRLKQGVATKDIVTRNHSLYVAHCKPGSVTVCMSVITLFGLDGRVCQPVKLTCGGGEKVARATREDSWPEELDFEKDSVETGHSETDLGTQMDPSQADAK